MGHPSIVRYADPVRSHSHFPDTVVQGCTAPAAAKGDLFLLDLITYLVELKTVENLSPLSDMAARAEKTCGAIG